MLTDEKVLSLIHKYRRRVYYVMIYSICFIVQLLIVEFMTLSEYPWINILVFFIAFIKTSLFYIVLWLFARHMDLLYNWYYQICKDPYFTVTTSSILSTNDESAYLFEFFQKKEKRANCVQRCMVCILVLAFIIGLSLEIVYVTGHEHTEDSTQFQIEEYFGSTTATVFNTFMDGIFQLFISYMLFKCVYMYRRGLSKKRLNSP